MQVSTRPIRDRHIRAKMPGQLRIVWQASTVRCVSSLSTGAAYTRVFRCPPWDSMHVSTRPIRDRHIRAKMPGQLRIVWQASTGAAYTRVFRCPHKGFESGGERGDHAVGPPLPIHRSWYTAKMCRSTIVHYLSCSSQIKCFRSHVFMDFILVLVCGTRAQSLSTPFSYILYSLVISKTWAEDKISR
jgi:hypothetical protein